MVAPKTSVDSVAARRIWDDYQRTHDVSARQGQTAGIEPATGQIWFGDSIEQVISQRDAAGSAAPLFFIRIGSPTYYRKGAAR